MARFNHFAKIGRDVSKNAHSLLDAYQAFWVDAAKQLAPIDQGDLRNSGTTADGDDEYSRKIAFTAAHAMFQEFGTVNMAAQPFVKPSRDALQGAFLTDGRSLFGGGFGR